MNAFRFSFLCLIALLSFSFTSDSYKVGSIELGEASYYARKFHGAKTASGELFDMHAYTAAHRYLPFGSLVRVTNQKNNKQVVLRINDRGPFVADRIIDVSYQAAKVLGLVRAGVAPVQLQVVRLGESGPVLQQQNTTHQKVTTRPVRKTRTIKKTSAPFFTQTKRRVAVYSPEGKKRLPQGYTTQVGGFRSLDRAKACAERLTSAGYGQVFLEIQHVNKTTYLIRVLVGTESQREAYRTTRKLRRKGFSRSFVRPHDTERKKLKAGY